MKLIYLTNDGKFRVETARVGTRLIEMPDGYHPITNDSVWQDAKRKSDGIMILIQGVLGPYGSGKGEMTEEDVLTTLREVEYAEKSFKPMSNSKMWQRSLASMFAWFYKYGITLFIAGIAGYALVTQFTEG